MPVLTLDLTLTEGEADRIAALLHTDREATENGTAAYFDRLTLIFSRALEETCSSC